MNFNSRKCFHRLIAASLFASVGFIECSPGLAQVVPFTTADLKARPLRVALVQCPVPPVPPGEPSPSPLLPLLLPILLPPIIEAGFGILGESLIAASGKNRQIQSLTGLANGMFYQTNGKDLKPNIDCIYLTVEGNAHLTKPGDKSSWAAKKLFEAMLKINYSPDKTAFFVEPLWVIYPKPILNERARGVAIAVDFKSPGGTNQDKSFLRESLLLLGKVACGKPGSRNISYSSDGKRLRLEDSEIHRIKCGNAVSSAWNILPPYSAEKSTPEVLPVVITAKLMEASDYSRLLFELGNIIQENKKALASATITQVPPSIYPPNYTKAANLAESRVKYISAKANYAKLLQAHSSGEDNCPALLEAWKTVVQTSVSAEVQDELVNSPPKCLQ